MRQVKDPYEIKNEPKRYNSPPFKTSTEQVRVVKHMNMQPSIQTQQKSEVRQLSNPPSVSPTVSFGVTNSGLKGLHNQKIVNLDNGDFYEGQISSKGEFQGRGKYSFVSQKLQYQGDFFDGKQHGRGQLIKFLNHGSSLYNRSKSNIDKFVLYDGQWKYGMKFGQGRYNYDSEYHYYSGSWVNNERNGRGKYVGPFGIYEGEWKNGKAHGNGLLTLKNNTKFDGKFVENQFLSGTITFPNKDEYTGQLKNGLRNDNQAKYTYKSKNDEKKQYIGGWKNDKKNDEQGQGTVIYENGCSFKGTYKEGNFIEHLECLWEWPDGTQFKGWFGKEKVHNAPKRYIFKGVIKAPNGREYEVNQN